MYRALVLIGILCSLLIVAVYWSTLPYVEANKEAALRRAIYSVLGKVNKVQTLQWQNNRWLVSNGIDYSVSNKVFAGLDENNGLVAFAVMASGKGYQDSIELMYGYSPIRQAIIGLSILENRETPGLGNKIASDPNFLAQFHQLNVSLNESRTRLLHEIIVAKKGRKAQAWQIDSISGATISSKAVAEILNKSASQWIPRLKQLEFSMHNLLSAPADIDDRRNHGK